MTIISCSITHCSLNNFLKFEPFLTTLPYKDNEIIDSYQFASYQKLEQDTLEWIHDHAFLFDAYDFIKMAKHIQNLHEQVTKRRFECLQRCHVTYPRCAYTHS